MKPLAPWTGIGTVKQEMDRLFDRSLDTGTDVAAFGEWSPKLEVTERTYRSERSYGMFERTLRRLATVPSAPSAWQACAFDDVPGHAPRGRS